MLSRSGHVVIKLVQLSNNEWLSTLGLGQVRFNQTGPVQDKSKVPQLVNTVVNPKH